MKSKYLILLFIILIPALLVASLSSQITSPRIESHKFSITAIGRDKQNQTIEQPLQVISEQIEKKDAKNCIILRFPDGIPMNIMYLLIVAEQLPVSLKPALKKEPWALFSLNQLVDWIPLNERLLLLFNSELDIRSLMKKYSVFHGLIRLQLLRLKFLDYAGNPVEDSSALVAPGLTLVRLDLKNRPPSPEQEETCSFHRHYISIPSRQIKGTIYVEAPPLPGNYDMRVGDRWYFPQKLIKESTEVEWRQVYERKIYRCQVVDAESDKPLQGAYVMFNPAADRNAWQLVSMPEEYRDDLYRSIPLDGCLYRSTKHSVSLPYGYVEKIEYLGRTDKHGLFFLEFELDKQVPDIILWAHGYVGMIATVYKIQKYGYPNRTGTVHLQEARLLPAGTVRLTIQPPYRIPISILMRYKTLEEYVRNAGLSAEVIFEGTKRISSPWLTPYPSHLVAGSNETDWCLVTSMGANIRFNKEFICHLPAGVQCKLRIYHEFGKYFQDILLPIEPPLEKGEVRTIEPQIMNVRTELITSLTNKDFVCQPTPTPEPEYSNKLRHIWRIIDAETSQPIAGAYVSYSLEPWCLMSLPELDRKYIFRQIPSDGKMYKTEEHCISSGGYWVVDYVGRADQEGRVIVDISGRQLDYGVWAPGYVGAQCHPETYRMLSSSLTGSFSVLPDALLVPAGTVSFKIIPPLRTEIEQPSQEQTHLFDISLDFQGDTKWLYPTHPDHKINDSIWFYRFAGGPARYKKQNMVFVPAGLPCTIRLTSRDKTLNDVILNISEPLKKGEHRELPPIQTSKRSDS